MQYFGIYFGMTLDKCLKNLVVFVKNINTDDYKLKLRLCELGFFTGSKIKVLNISSLKKTLLVQVLDSCFTIKSKTAELIEVCDG